MLDLVVGERRNPLAADALLQHISAMPLTGTLYLGYPILATADQTVLIDGLLTSLEHGVVILDFNGHETALADPDAVRQRQDDLYTALFQKFLSFRPLRAGRGLTLEIHVLTMAPDVKDEASKEGLLIVSHTNLTRVIEGFPPISADQLRDVNAAVQRVTTIKPPQKRVSVQRRTSRGGLLKQIEAEIANLDRWQKRAAIETPDAPQRIRGLAGSGKTIVLALKASYLHVLNPEWKIAVTFQTRSLYQQFRDLIRRFTFDAIHDEPDWDQLRVLHAWGSAGDPGIYSELSLTNDIKPRDFLYGKETYGWDQAFGGVCGELLASLGGRNPEPIFDAILIDEAQDFPQAFFELAHLAVCEPKRVIFAYDELQNLGVYSMSPPSELFGQDANGRPRVPELSNEPRSPHQDIVLPVCYRNTPWALTIAHALGFGIYRDGGLVQFFDDPHLWSDIGYEVVAGDMSPGRRIELRRSRESFPGYFTDLLQPEDAVQHHTFGNDEDQARWLAENIQRNLTQDELEFRDILVIIANPVTAAKRAATIVRHLEERNIPAHLAGVTTSRDVLFDEDSVAISSIYRAKGNEAPMVYLLDSDYCYSGFELIKRRNILFTAMTRSRAWVRLAGCGEKMDSLSDEVKAVVASNYSLRFTVPTGPELDKMRKIHRDMSKKERERAHKIEQTLESFAELAERGDLSLDQLPPELRERLKSLFAKK